MINVVSLISLISFAWKYVYVSMSDFLVYSTFLQYKSHKLLLCVLMSQLRGATFWFKIRLWKFTWKTILFNDLRSHLKQTWLLDIFSHYKIQCIRISALIICSSSRRGKCTRSWMTLIGVDVYQASTECTTSICY